MSVRRALRARLSSREDGFTLVEVIVAVTLLAIAGASFAVSTGNGFVLIGRSQERQTATQLANQWMEGSRVVPYDSLALPTDTVFGGAGTPDEDVTGGTMYTTSAGTETLVFDTVVDFLHYEATVVNGVSYGMYRYVTWVADGADTEAYKRVTIVVQWEGSGEGDPEAVTVSSLMTSDGVAWASTTSTSSTSTSTTSTTAATTTTTGVAVCAGDVTAPVTSLSILAGSGSQSGYTSSSTVSLSMSATDACTPMTMSFSNDGSSYSTPETFTSSKSWTLASGDGAKTMYARIADANGNTTTRSASVIVDTAAPTTPGSFTATVLTGPKRVRLTFTQSTDGQGVIGYRVYRKRGSGSFTNLSTGVSHPCSTSPCTYTDSGVQNNNTYTYYVVAYDAAGNQSVATSQITRTI